MARIPIFELHIRPMFRLIDDDHMLQRHLDLTDYDTVKTEAHGILDHLRSTNPMPTKATGGPWPEEWIALFERWTEHFHKLDQNTGSDYNLEKIPGQFQLSCKSAVPHFGASTWLDYLGTRTGVRVYNLVLERAVPAPPDFETEVTLREFIPESEQPGGVWVQDANDEHFVSLSTVS